MRFHKTHKWNLLLGEGLCTLTNINTLLLEVEQVSTNSSCLKLIQAKVLSRLLKTFKHLRFSHISFLFPSNRNRRSLNLKKQIMENQYRIWQEDQLPKDHKISKTQSQLSGMRLNNWKTKISKLTNFQTWSNPYLKNRKT